MEKYLYRDGRRQLDPIMNKVQHSQKKDKDVAEQRPAYDLEQFLQSFRLQYFVQRTLLFRWIL